MVFDCLKMLDRITLLNVPQADLLARITGLPSGPHIYPFYDEALYEAYRYVLPLGEESIYPWAHIHGPQATPAMGTALEQCWMATEFAVVLAPGGRPTAWPFEKTAIQDVDSTAVPTDLGLLDPEDLGDEVTAALAGTRTPTQAPAAAATLLKPQASTLRTRKFRLDIPSPLCQVLRRWRQHVNMTYNEAIKQVNMVIRQSDLPNERDLYVSLVNRNSAFVKKRPYLQDCPTVARRDAVDRAVANRAAILTRYYHLPAA